MHEQQVAVSQARSGSSNSAGPEQSSRVPKQIQQTQIRAAESYSPADDAEGHNTHATDMGVQEVEGMGESGGNEDDGGEEDEEEAINNADDGDVEEDQY